MTLALLVSSAAAQAAEEGEIRVAVIDTGISTAAVSPARIHGGINYIRPQDDLEDKLGHGTAVSAIIVGSEAARITGICPDAKLVPLVTATKDENGVTVQGDTAMAAKAIRDAVDIYGCRIINISSGAASSSWQLSNAVAYAQERGALVIASAGNNQKKNPGAIYYPGGYDGVLCVGAANEDGSVASYSQQNDTVDLLALGSMRVATIKGTRIRGEGTSYSTAIVTGAAAQIWTKYPQLTADEVRNILLESSRTIDGWQVFDLEAALAWAPKDNAGIFSDVTEGAYYYDAVLWAVEQGITTGTSATTFSPDDPCTRGQMATFLWRAAGSPEPVGKTCIFADVPADAYYAKAVQWAVEQKITGGTSATTYSPDAPCTRGQMATFLCRMAGGVPESDTVVFSDVSPGAYYAKPIQWAYEQKLTGGTGAATFDPDATCTRSQMVTFLYRYFVK